MGFRIFASGATNFSYERDGCEDGGTFDTIQLISTLQGIDVSSLEAAGKGYGYSQIDSQSEPKSMVDVMMKLLYKEMLHNLSNAVCFLAMNSNSGDGWIYVHATETHALWADTVRSAKYYFSPGNSPGAEFISTIGRCLKETDLDNFGVLQQMSIALNNYCNSIDDSVAPKISISLTH